MATREITIQVSGVVQRVDETPTGIRVQQRGPTGEAETVEIEAQQGPKGDKGDTGAAGAAGAAGSESWEVLTQAEYDALADKDDNTLYLVTA